MDSSEKTRFYALYAKHLRALKLQGKAPKRIESYARALPEVSRYLNRGVIRDGDLLDFDPLAGTVTFRYRYAQSRFDGSNRIAPSRYGRYCASEPGPGVLT